MSLTSEPVILMSCQSKLHVAIHVPALKATVYFKSKSTQQGLPQTENSFKTSQYHPDFPPSIHPQKCTKALTKQMQH